MQGDRMKTPITYYGGKQNLSKTILRLIPPHDIYVEPFCGGCAIFFAKEPSKCEVINDTNGEVVNFYRVLQKQFTELQKEIQATPHSRQCYNEAKEVYRSPEKHTEVKRAWAFWVCANMSFAAKIGAGWAYSNNNFTHIKSRRDRFTQLLADRIESAQIENTDAIKLIPVRDSASTFFYCDPPYINTNQGHYSGYTLESFENLLGVLSKIKGKFLLSSYQCAKLEEYKSKYNWHQIEIEVPLCAAKGRARNGKTRTEVLTANYPIKFSEYEEQDLFEAY
jgi:DNA adenine methylase